MSIRCGDYYIRRRMMQDLVSGFSGPDTDDLLKTIDKRGAGIYNHT